MSHWLSVTLPGAIFLAGAPGSGGRGLLCSGQVILPPPLELEVAQNTLAARAGGHHPSTRLHWGLFLVFPLPPDKGNPVYLPFCWYISLPFSPSVNPRETEDVPQQVWRMQAMLPLLPGCSSCSSWRIRQARRSSNPSAAHVRYGGAATRH